MRRRLMMLPLAAALLPATMAFAQQPAGGRRGGGDMGNGGAMQVPLLREVLSAADLTGDEKDKTDAILTKAQADVRQARQDMQDAAPEDRADKRRDMMKMQGEVKAKVMDALTPPHQADVVKRLAVLTVARVRSAVDAEQKAAAGVDADADKKKQVDDALTEAGTTLDGFKADADKVADEPAEAALTKKVVATFTDAQRQVAQALGRQEAQPVVRAGLQAIAGNARGGGRPGGAGGRHKPPTTAPADADK